MHFITPFIDLMSYILAWLISTELMIALVPFY